MSVHLELTSETFLFGVLPFNLVAMVDEELDSMRRISVAA